MCKLKKFLSIIVILCWYLAENHKNFSGVDFAASLFINFSLLFFAIVAIIGVVQSNIFLLGTWIVFAIIELSRSAIVLYDSWSDNNENMNEKIFNTCDVATQALTVFFVSVLFEIIKLQNKTRSKISTIGGSLELNRRMHEKLKPPTID
jgi:hypothetical protein